MTIKDIFNIPKRIKQGEGTRRKIEKTIQIKSEMIEACEIEKQKCKTDIKKYCQIWSVQKDYQKTVELLKELL